MQLFIQEEGSDYMDPFPKNATVTTLHSDKTGDIPLNAASGGWEGGDIILVNGKVWPTVKVQRKPYFFVVQNHAVARVFNIHLTNQNGTSLMNAQGVFWLVGSDGGFRSSPVQAANGLDIGTGERYMVVIDFTSFEVGDVLYLQNFPTETSEVPTYCYTHLLLKIIIDGTDPIAPQFVPTFTTDVFKETGMTEAEMQEACYNAMNGMADVEMQTTFNLQMENTQGIAEQSVFGRFTFNSVTNAIIDNQPSWTINLMGNIEQPENMTDHPLWGMRRALKDRSGTEAAPRRKKARSLQGLEGSKRRLSQMVHTNSTFLPTSMATNGYTSWWIYNPFPAVHPLHIHLVEFFVCGRKTVRGLCRPGIDSYYPCPPAGATPHYGVRDYEILTPKDIVVIPAFSQVAVVARYGPHEGSYQFHCHNLIHEDEGLMAVFNSTSAFEPNEDAMFAPNGTEPKRFRGGYDLAPDSPRTYKGKDPLVKNVKENPAIGHNLYTVGSMPPWAYRTTADGKPQPLTKKLLQDVLKRNYYEIFYPDSRDNLQKKVKKNMHAVICPKQGSRR